MKALVLAEYRKLEYTEVPAPKVGNGEVLVRVKACGICGSDVHGMDGSTGRRKPPVIMGHEASGVIASVGKGVAGWKEGERVTFDSTIFCGECWYCRRGWINLCDARLVLGVSCDEYRRDGAFAEYVTVPPRILYRLPPEVSFEHAALAETLSIALHAVRRTPVALADSAVVVGAGAIGLFIVQALRNSGCGRIVVVDVDDSRLDLARRLGADVAARPEEARAAVGERGADIAFEAVGNTAALSTALSSLRKGGSLTLVGNVSPTVDLPLQTVVVREISVRGTCASCWEYPAGLDMIARGKVDVASLVSAVAPLSEGASWFDRLYRREKGLMKVILVP